MKTRRAIAVAAMGMLLCGLPALSDYWYFDSQHNLYICVTSSTYGGSKCSTCPLSPDPPPDMGCAWLRFSTGNMHPGTSLPQGYLRVAEEKATAALYTPTSMRYVLGYGIYGFSQERTSGDVPRELVMIQKWGLTAGYRFEDGASIGLPYLGPQKAMQSSVVMVDAEGWSVTNDPAYYDFYPGDGELYRFGATTNSDEFMQLVLHRTATGREETLSDIDTEIIRDDDSVLRQVLSPSRLVDIVVENDHKYSVNMYKRTDVQAEKDGDGYYQADTNAGPVLVWIVENPEPATTEKLRVSKVVGSFTNVWNYTYIADSEEWQLESGNGLRTKIMVTSLTDSGDLAGKTWITKDANNNIVSKLVENINMFGFGPAVTSAVTDPVGLALTDEFTYYTDSAETGKYGNTKTRKRSDGSWESFDYTGSGAVSVHVTPWQDSPFDSPATSAKAIYYDYTAVDTNDTLVFNDQRPRTVTEKILGQVVSKTYYAYVTNSVGELKEIIEKCVDPTASYGDSDSLRTVTINYGTNTSNEQIGRIKTIEYPDGRLDTHTYEYGNYHPSNSSPADSWFEPNSNGYAWRETIVHGTTNSPDGIANKTTREVKVLDEYSQDVLTETYVHTGGANYERIAWSVQEFDDHFKSTKVSKSTGKVRDTTWAACACQKASEVDASGVENVYSYDLLNRLITSTKKGTSSPTNDLNREFTYDAMDRRLTEEISGGSLSLITRSNQYDLAGRMISSVDTLGIETAYSHQNGGRITTVVRAGLTNVTERYLDGRTKCTKQNGVVKTWYDYGVNANGTQWTTTYTGPDHTNSLMWTKTTADMLGRTVLGEKPGFGGTTLTNEHFYNTRGLLVRTTSPGMADTLYEHDSLGNQTRSGLDVDDDGVLTPASMDRISETERYFGRADFTSATNEWASISVSKLCPVDGTNTVVTNSISRTRLTGLGSAGFTPATILVSESVSIDIHGNETTARTELDRDSRKTVQLVNYPDSTNDAVSTSTNGLLMSSETKTGVITSHGYDALERRCSSRSVSGTSGERLISSTTHYNDKGQVDYVEDSASNRTSYAYSATTGRRTAVTNALGKITRYEYSQEGQLVKTWGDTVYPVSYSFDDYDKMQSMTTYRGGLGWSGSSWPTNTGIADTTQWLYDEATGLLTNKLYADGNGTAYSYTSDGKLQTRTWARGITTTYSYTNTTGEMIGIDYSDSTPGISFTYNRLGQQVTVADAQGSRTFAYNQYLALTNETVVTADGTNVITRNQDSYGRTSGLNLSQGGTAAPLSVAYGHEGAGRFETVDSVVLGVTNNWQYSYLRNSNLISGFSNSVASVSTVRDYENSRNLLTDVHNQTQGSTISKYQYSNDALGRRTQRIDTTVSVVTNDFGYDDRSQITNAIMGAESFGFDFDNIGNRETYTTNGTTFTYTANQLNQYTQITNGGVETLTWDVDGNMLTYNGWTYSWNGENRLIKTESLSAVPDEFKVCVENVYDYAGRRVRKTVSDDYAGGSYTTTNVTTYVWDGWNIIAEMCDAGYTNFNCWGIDISGTLGGAGGVGGLLAVTRDTGTATNTYYPCFDGNGNVCQYVDESGTVVAHREYTPFGQTIALTGDQKDDFTHWWSTKPWDAETKQSKYQQRDYLPELGRFGSKDPIGIRGGINEYCFVQNDPIGRIDPYGLKWTPNTHLTDDWGPQNALSWFMLGMGKSVTITGDAFDNHVKSMSSINTERKWLHDRIDKYLDGKCKNHSGNAKWTEQWTDTKIIPVTMTGWRWAAFGTIYHDASISCEVKACPCKGDCSITWNGHDNYHKFKVNIVPGIPYDIFWSWDESYTSPSSP